MVRSLARSRALGAGPWNLVWDGRRDDGREAAGGVYFIRLRAGDESWSTMVVRMK